MKPTSDDPPREDSPRGPVFHDVLGRRLFAISEGFAVLGGLILVGLAVMLTVSIIGRKLYSVNVYGDYELVQMFGALAVSLFFPWCHLSGGNVVVDLLTNGLPDAATRILDRIGSLLFAAMALLLAWRCGLLAIGSYEDSSFSSLLAWKLWPWQALMIPSLILTAVNALYLAFASHALADRKVLAQTVGAEP